ncbi:uncharacterized protein LOC126668298 [Mercurialis annua]|uniref:uncharacterized protein LOC126668298 n=1 Tax=Mercurialis annua TaxID=3986 RepID=UPI00215E3D21|nr:uncharacterized protein LOC126668298 [Mercurialis annua]
MIFRETFQDPGEVIANATDLQAEFLRARSRSHSAQQPLPATMGVQYAQQTLSSWSPPPANVFKLNFDGAFQAAMSSGVGAVVVRNHRGVVFNSTTKRYPYVTSPATIEAMALRDAINLAISLQLPEVIFEGDAKVIIEAMSQNSKVDYNTDVIIQDCKVLLNNIMPHSFHFVRRASNWVAHSLAKKALTDNSFCSKLEQYMKALEVHELLRIMRR